MEIKLNNVNTSINNIRNILEQEYQKTHHKKQAFIQTYGCQMNEHDSEKLFGMLKKMGYGITDDINSADLIILNTCAVREKAELKVFGKLGHLKTLKKKNDNLIVAICGCMMQQEHVIEKVKRNYSHVDLIFGTHSLFEFPKLLENLLATEEQQALIYENNKGIIEGLPSDRKYSSKAFINIMYGCNNFCTYCIVPHTRGRERSREMSDIINEIKECVANGVVEVMLLGQNVNSYGKSLSTPADFSDLLKAVNAIEGLKRIRFMTSHPKDLNYKLIDTVAECEKVCEHMHFPVQAGSNKLLKKMNRGYTIEQYLEMIDYIREKLPTASISTDLIIGFPGETEDDINDLIKVLDYIKYDAAYTFMYSKRKGTPAAEYPEQVNDKLKHSRFEKVLETINKHIVVKNKNMKDQTVPVLVESFSKTNENILTGKTRQHVTVNFKGDESLIGKIVNVKITDPKKFSLNGVYVENSN